MTSFEDWYFDSGCSRHMTGNSLLFAELNVCRIGRVTFGDDVKGNVVGKRNIDRPRVPEINNVHLVEGLSANLISINQLCDQGFMVNFSKDSCEVLDAEKNTMMTGTRLSNNCYH